MKTKKKAKRVDISKCENNKPKALKEASNVCITVGTTLPARQIAQAVGGESVKIKHSMPSEKAGKTFPYIQ